MPVCSVCCLIVLIVFVSPHKANTKNLPCMIVWKSDQWREICFTPECSVCFKWFTALIMTLNLFLLLFLHTAHTILLLTWRQANMKTMSGKCSNRLWRAAVHYSVLHLELIFHQCWFDVFSSILIFLTVTSRTMTEQKCRHSRIWGAYVVEDWSCWAEEGAGVNYSITGWLSQELFKQAPASRGLGLITPAKVTPTTLPHSLLLRVCQAFWGIFIWREEGTI